MCSGDFFGAFFSNRFFFQTAARIRGSSGRVFAAAVDGAAASCDANAKDALLHHAKGTGMPKRERERERAGGKEKRGKVSQETGAIKGWWVVVMRGGRGFIVRRNRREGGE